jgi:hypothetical protein
MSTGKLSDNPGSSKHQGHQHEALNCVKFSYEEAPTLHETHCRPKPSAKKPNPSEQIILVLAQIVDADWEPYVGQRRTFALTR